MRNRARTLDTKEVFVPTKPGKPEEYYGLQLDFDVVKKILGCTSIQIVPLPNKQDILITDESGLLKEPRDFIQLNKDWYRSMDQPQSSVWWILPRAKLATVSSRARICQFVCLGRLGSRFPTSAPQQHVALMPRSRFINASGETLTKF